MFHCITWIECHIHLFIVFKSIKYIGDFIHYKNGNEENMPKKNEEKSKCNSYHAHVQRVGKCMSKLSEVTLPTN